MGEKQKLYVYVLKYLFYIFLRISPPLYKYLNFSLQTKSHLYDLVNINTKNTEAPPL